MSLRQFCLATSQASAVNNTNPFALTNPMPLLSNSARPIFTSPTQPVLMSWSKQHAEHKPYGANVPYNQGCGYGPWHPPRRVGPVFYTNPLHGTETFPNPWRIAGALGFNTPDMFGNAYATMLRPPVENINPFMEPTTETGTTHVSPQQHVLDMMHSQSTPNPWDLQKPVGFAKMRAQSKNRPTATDEVAGPSSSNPPAASSNAEPDPKLQHFMFDLGMIPKNPTGTINKRYELVDTTQEHKTRSGQTFRTTTGDKKIVIFDHAVPGECSSITGGPVYRCQMCDEKIDPDICKTADLRYCPDCYFYVYGWKRPS